MPVRTTSPQAAPRRVDFTESSTVEISFSFVEGSGTVDVQYSIADDRPVRFRLDGKAVRELTVPSVRITSTPVRQPLELCGLASGGPLYARITVGVYRNGELLDRGWERIAVQNPESAPCS